MSKVIALLLLCSNLAMAADPDNVPLVAGEPAPYSGILFPIPRAQRIELMTIDLATCEKRLDLAGQVEDIYAIRTDNLTKVNATLMDENSKRHTFLDSFLPFVLGAATTILIGYGLHKATN